MTELLALPGWNTPPTALDAWVEALGSPGHAVVTTRESTTVSWVEIAALRCRGYVLMQGQHVEAINFELTALDPAPARAFIEAVAVSLGWEIHDDDGPDDEE